MDYYELLGVDEDAPVDDIRSAYRERKAAVTENEKVKDTDQAKADVAALNKAWNVLSDPYQRGRYDQERADASESDDDDDGDDDDDVVTPVRRATKTPEKSTGKRQTAAERREARAAAVPTVALPAGTYFPKTKRRLIAMVIDIAVLLVLFVGSQLLVVHLEKSNHKAVYDRVTALNNHAIPDAQKVANTAKKKASKNVDCTKPATGDDKTYCDAKTKVDDLNKELTAKQKVLAPTQNLVSGAFFLLSLLILVVPSLFGGQTLGKRLQHVRVIRVDGSPARWTDIFRRYTALVFAAYVLSTVLRSPVGALIVVFVATLWTRNPNQQALQDKFAKTLVVTDVEE